MRGFYIEWLHIWLQQITYKYMCTEDFSSLFKKKTVTHLE